MKRYGLVGYPLGHSFSKNYFEAKFLREGITDCSFENFQIENLDHLREMIGGDVKGFSVTIPHKRAIMPLLSAIDPAAAAAGAVNCVKCLADGRWEGYNTDITGFEVSLAGMLDGARPRALIFGTGGASAAVKYVLQKLGIEYVEVSRRKSAVAVAYGEVDRKMMESHELLINTTPLGMCPAADAAVDIPYDALTGGHYLYDLVYNPAETLFLCLGRRHGARVKNGLEMLTLQAEAAWSIWNS